MCRHCSVNEENSISVYLDTLSYENTWFATVVNIKVSTELYARQQWKQKPAVLTVESCSEQNEEWCLSLRFFNIFYYKTSSCLIRYNYWSSNFHALCINPNMKHFSKIDLAIPKNKLCNNIVSLMVKWIGWAAL